MTRNIYIKTSRAKYGYARATITRFMNYTDNKICYSFQFYRTHKYFKTYNELRDFVESNYQLLSSEMCRMVEYHLPENRNEFFR